MKIALKRICVINAATEKPSMSTLRCTTNSHLVIASAQIEFRFSLFLFDSFISARRAAFVQISTRWNINFILLARNAQPSMLVPTQSQRKKCCIDAHQIDIYLSPYNVVVITWDLAIFGPNVCSNAFGNGSYPKCAQHRQPFLSSWRRPTTPLYLERSTCSNQAGRCNTQIVCWLQLLQLDNTLLCTWK